MFYWLILLLFYFPFHIFSPQYDGVEEADGNCDPWKRLSALNKAPGEVPFSSDSKPFYSPWSVMIDKTLCYVAVNLLVM